VWQTGHPVELAAEIAGLVHLGRPFADADREHGAHTGFMRAAKHFFAVVCVARAVEVRVGIYKHLWERSDLVNSL
jgi:hypothetical protein